MIHKLADILHPRSEFSLAWVPNRFRANQVVNNLLYDHCLVIIEPLPNDCYNIYVRADRSTTLDLAYAHEGDPK